MQLQQAPQIWSSYSLSKYFEWQKNKALHVKWMCKKNQRKKLWEKQWKGKSYVNEMTIFANDRTKYLDLEKYVFFTINLILNNGKCLLNQYIN